MGKRTQTLDRGRLEKSVLWTGESKFEVFWSHRRTFVRRRTSEKMLEECLTPSVKHGGGNVMVRGCFGAGKVEDLYKVKGRLSLHFAMPCHTQWTALVWCQFPPTTGQWPKAHLQTMQELFKEEAVSWYSVCNGVASAVTRSQPYWAVVGAAWPSVWYVRRAHQAKSNLWEVLQEAWGEISSDYLKNWQFECQRSAGL